MNLKRIESKDFEYFYSLLQEDFCYEERKTKEDELKAFSNMEFRPYFIYDDEKLIGYFCYWEFDEFIFGEHFAILKDLRNKGYGSRFIAEMLKNQDKLVLFEVEPPITNIQKRRVGFYKKLGFQFNDFEYIQPSYHNADDKVRLVIATYPRLISKNEYDKYTAIVKSKVYIKN